MCKLQSLHLHCAFLFILKYLILLHIFSHLRRRTPSPHFQHMVHVRQHNHTDTVYILLYSFMLNILFANPFCFINTNVGPFTHPYYTRCYDSGVSYVISMQPISRGGSASFMPTKGGWVIEPPLFQILRFLIENVNFDWLKDVCFYNCMENMKRPRHRICNHEQYGEFTL